MVLSLALVEDTNTEFCKSQVFMHSFPPYSTLFLQIQSCTLVPRFPETAQAGGFLALAQGVTAPLVAVLTAVPWIHSGDIALEGQGQYREFNAMTAISRPGVRDLGSVLCSY